MEDPVVIVLESTNYHKSLIGILYKELNMQIQLILSSSDKIRECSSDHVRHRTRD